MAGGVSGRYHNIKLDKKLYTASRLAFLFMVGSFPTNVVDHINGDSYDNRWSNLRDCTANENQQNRLAMRPGFTGAHKHRNKFTAEIMANKTRYYLGSFNTVEEAHAAYMKAKQQLHTTDPYNGREKKWV